MGGECRQIVRSHGKEFGFDTIFKAPLELDKIKTVGLTNLLELFVPIDLKINAHQNENASYCQTVYVYIDILLSLLIITYYIILFYTYIFPFLATLVQVLKFKVQEMMHHAHPWNFDTL